LIDHDVYRQSVVKFLLKETVPGLLLVACAQRASLIALVVDKPVHILSITDSLFHYLLQFELFKVVLVEVLFVFIGGALLDEPQVGEMLNVLMCHPVYDFLCMVVVKLSIDVNCSY